MRPSTSTGERLVSCNPDSVAGERFHALGFRGRESRTADTFYLDLITDLFIGVYLNSFLFFKITKENSADTYSARDV